MFTSEPGAGSLMRQMVVGCAPSVSHGASVSAGSGSHSTPSKPVGSRTRPEPSTQQYCAASGTRLSLRWYSSGKRSRPGYAPTVRPSGKSRAANAPRPAPTTRDGATASVSGKIQPRGRSSYARQQPVIAIAASHGFGSKIAQSESARTQARGAGDGRRSGGRRSPATE